MKQIALQDMTPFPASAGDLHAFCRRLGPVVDKARAPVGLEFEDARTLWVALSADQWQHTKAQAFDMLLRAAFEWIARVVARNDGMVYFGGTYPALAEHVEPNTGVVIAAIDVSILVTVLELQPEDASQRVIATPQLHGVTGNA